MDKLEMMLKELDRYSWDDVREYDYIEDYDFNDTMELEFIDIRKEAIINGADDYGFDEYDVKCR